MPVLWLAVLQYLLHVVNHLVDVGNAEPSWVGPIDVLALTLGAVAFAAVLVAGRPAT
jgi:hypothetical protein